MVHRKKDLVPCEIGTAAGQIFELAAMGPTHDVDNLIFYGCMVCHAPPHPKRDALLETALHRRCHCTVSLARKEMALEQ